MQNSEGFPWALYIILVASLSSLHLDPRCIFLILVASWSSLHLDPRSVSPAGREGGGPLAGSTCWACLPGLLLSLTDTQKPHRNTEETSCGFTTDRKSFCGNFKTRCVCLWVDESQLEWLLRRACSALATWEVHSPCQGSQRMNAVGVHHAHVKVPRMNAVGNVHHEASVWGLTAQITPGNDPQPGANYCGVNLTW